MCATGMEREERARACTRGGGAEGEGVNGESRLNIAKIIHPSYIYLFIIASHIISYRTIIIITIIIIVSIPQPFIAVFISLSCLSGSVFACFGQVVGGSCLIVVLAWPGFSSFISSSLRSCVFYSTLS